MKKLVLFLSVCALLASAVWVGAAGDAGDPLASLSYLNGEFSQRAEKKIDQALEQSDKDLAERLSDHIQIKGLYDMPVHIRHQIVYDINLIFIIQLSCILCAKNSFLAGYRPVRLHINASEHLADTAAGINIIIRHKCPCSSAIGAYLIGWLAKRTVIVAVNLEPFPSSLSTAIVPPIISTMFFVMAIPSPVP